MAADRFCLSAIRYYLSSVPKFFTRQQNLKRHELFINLLPHFYFRRRNLLYCSKKNRFEEMFRRATEKKMREITLPMSAIPKMRRMAMPRAERRISFGNSESWWNFLAVLGTGGGILFGLVGVFMICFASLFDSFEFGQYATAFIIVAFPLAMMGANALDKLEGINKRKLK